MHPCFTKTPTPVSFFLVILRPQGWNRTLALPHSIVQSFLHSTNTFICILPMKCLARVYRKCGGWKLGHTRKSLWHCICCQLCLIFPVPLAQSPVGLRHTPVLENHCLESWPWSHKRKLWRGNTWQFTDQSFIHPCYVKALVMEGWLWLFLWLCLVMYLLHSLRFSCGVVGVLFVFMKTHAYWVF